MRKLMLSVIMLVALVGVSQGQIVTYATDSVAAARTDSSFSEVVTRIRIANPRNNAINVTWKRIINDFPAGWIGTQICDINLCYQYNVSSQNFDLPANSDTTIDVHFANDSMGGVGHVRLLLYETADSADSDTELDYYAFIARDSVFITSVAPRHNEQASLSIFPNPAKDYFMIKSNGASDLDRVEVYSMLGRKVFTQALVPGEALAKIDLGDLQKGIYMVRVYDSANNVVLTKSISHAR